MCGKFSIIIFNALEKLFLTKNDLFFFFLFFTSNLQIVHYIFFLYITDALPSYLQGNTSHFLINQRIRINTIFRNIKEFYPNEWRTIKSNYERTLDSRQKTELDNALTRKVFADYPIDDFTREVMRCFLEDQCNLIVPNLKSKLIYNFFQPIIITYLFLLVVKFM